MSHPRPGYLIRTNAQGFRSDWNFQEKRNGKPRILFFGDSNTVGDGVDNPMRFSDVLGSELDCETYNFGLSGSGTDQQLLIREHLAFPYEADLVILCPYESNIMRNVVAYRQAVNRVTGKVIKLPKPYFELRDNLLTLHNQPVPKEREEMNSLEEVGNHKTLRSFTKMILKHIPQSRRLAVSLTDRKNAYSSPSSKPWHLMRILLERFVDHTRVPVIIFPLPAETCFVDRRTPSYLKRYHEWHAEYRKFTLVDILPTIRKIPLSERKRLHFADDPHFNELGHALIAKALMEPVRRLLAQS